MNCKGHYKTYGYVFSTANFTYEGYMLNDEPHGKGVFNYSNGDKYVGECRFGKHDGYGTYYFNDGSIYAGFSTIGKCNGIGTYENASKIFKGSWRDGKKHGVFIKTNKIRCVTYQQLWLKDKKISQTQIQYIQPAALQTVKENPFRKPKIYQTSYKGRDKCCITCMENPTNAVNSKCGHVALCYDCLNKCDRCPICRCNIENIIKLFAS